ncbi:MAG: zinc dependent phospholipase C family protein [Pseudomonadota bacterium]
MRYNGLQLVVRLAVRKLDLPHLTRFEDALVLGAIREDIIYLPRKKKIWEHWSLSHFSGRYLGGGFIPFLTTSAPRRAQHYVDLAVQAWHDGQPARAYVCLGMASHLVIDMACPVHASRVAHMNDGYEWYVEGNCPQLAALPFEVPQHYRSVHAAVAGLARFTRQFPPDRSNHHWGRLLKACGLRKTFTRTELANQAAHIIPAAAGHLAAVYLMFHHATRPT